MDELFRQVRPEDGLDSAQTLEMSEIMAEVLHGTHEKPNTPAGG